MLQYLPKTEKKRSFRQPTSPQRRGGPVGPPRSSAFGAGDQAVTLPSGTASQWAPLVTCRSENLTRYAAVLVEMQRETLGLRHSQTLPVLGHGLDRARASVEHGARHRHDLVVAEVLQPPPHERFARRHSAAKMLVLR